MNQEQKPVLFKIMDETGNILTKYEDGSIGMSLKSEYPRERKLGMIMNDTFYTSREDSHLHIKSNSYGFNHYLMKKSHFIYIMLSTGDGNYYRIPKSEILEKGKILHFKNSSDGNAFELQIFLELEIIKKYDIKNQQEKLF